MRSYRQHAAKLEIRDLWVVKNRKVLLMDVSVRIAPGTFTAIIGPNGAGKTTLLRAITGERPTRGQVLIDDQDLYVVPELWLPRIGYVPADNVLHEQLTVMEALEFIGRLRRPGMSLQKLRSSIDYWLGVLGFAAKDARRDRVIGKLSGGERKRVNICAELLGDPSLLVLDEPTSNLDPNAESDLMVALRNLAHPPVADTGQAARTPITVVIVTHTLNTLHHCDNVLFVSMPKCRPNCQGLDKPKTLVQWLPAPVTAEGGTNFAQWADVFERQKTEEAKRPTLKVHHLPGPIVPGAKAAPIRRSPSQAVHQFQVLFARYSSIRMHEVAATIMIMLFGVVGGILLFILPEQAFVAPNNAQGDAKAIVDARQSVFILALIVTVTGLIAGFLEISREYRIYAHERRKGLSASAYLLAKWIWLAVFVGLLTPLILMFILRLLGQPMPASPLPEPMVMALAVATLVLACVCSLTLGLTISAVAGDKTSLATSLLAVTVIFQMLFSGLLKNEGIEGLVNGVSQFAVSKWAREGLGSAISIYCWAPGKLKPDEFNSWGQLLSIWGALTAFTIVAFILGVLALYLRDVWDSPWHNFVRLITRNRQAILWGVLTLGILLSWTIYLRIASQDYHALTYSLDPQLSETGTDDRHWASIRDAADPNAWQTINGVLSQSWCTRESTQARTQ